MDLAIAETDLAWQLRAREFAERYLFPHEVELEMEGSVG